MTSMTSSRPTMTGRMPRTRTGRRRAGGGRRDGGGRRRAKDPHEASLETEDEGTYVIIAAIETAKKRVESSNEAAHVAASSSGERAVVVAAQDGGVDEPHVKSLRDDGWPLARQFRRPGLEVPRGKHYRFAGRELREQGRALVLLGRVQRVGNSLKQY